MMCYYLLRNNKESGPFSLKELKEMPLLTTDLIWINGESTCWKSPEEVVELKGLSQAPPSSPKAVKPADKATAPAMVYTATTHPADASAQATDSTTDSYTVAIEEPLPQPSFEELKKKYAAKAPRKKIWKTQINIGANLIGIATLVIGVSVAAFMIKKAVDNIEPEPMVATAEAVEIGNMDSHISTSSQAAMAPLATNAAAEPKTLEAMNETTPADFASAAIQVPVKEEPVVASPPPPVIKKETPKEKAEKEPVQKPVLLKEEPASDENKAEKETTGFASAGKEEENKETDESAEKKKSKTALQLSANEYKVGFLGGISNLELSVSNPSSKAVSKAVVVVEYLKPNGKVVGTQTVEVSGLAAGASKKVPVPDNGRGVAVRYRVMSDE